MKHLNSGTVALAALLLVAIQIFGRTSGMLNYPMVEGAGRIDSGNVRLKCNVEPNYNFKWTAIIPWSVLHLPLYASGQAVIPNENYTFDQNGTSFVIKKLTKDLASIYVCEIVREGLKDSSEIRVAAFAPMTCHPQGNSQPFVAGETIVFNCSTWYSSYVISPLEPLKPTMSLVGADGRRLAQARADGPGFVHLLQNVTMTEDMDNGQLSCRVFFEPSASTLVESPPYEDFCNYTVTVLHGVSLVKIDMLANDTQPSAVVVGQTISCSANGNPRPTLRWKDWNDTVISNDGNLTFTPEMVSTSPRKFVCEAMNTIDVPPANSPTVSTAIASVELIVNGLPVEGASSQLAGWQIALMVVIPLLAVLLILLVIFICLRKKNSKPYASTKNGKTDPTAKSLIYHPTPRAPGTGTGQPPYAAPPTYYPNNSQPQTFAPPSASPSVRGDYPNLPLGRPEYQGDFHGSNRNVNMNVSSGHGDLGRAGLSGSRAADLNAGSRGNLNDPTTGFQQPRSSDRFGGSSEGLDIPPLPPRQPEVGFQGQRATKQGNVRSPPPPASYLDNGFGRQPSITSTSTNRSASSEGSRAAGRGVDMNPSGRSAKGGGKKTSAGYPNHPEQGRKSGKKPTPNRQSDTNDAHSLQGSEV